MLVLFEHQSIDFKELSRIVDLKTGTLTPIIQNLEKVGYVHRAKNQKDNRKINVSLTIQGEELEQQIVAVPLGMANDLGVSEEMYRILVKKVFGISIIFQQSLLLHLIQVFTIFALILEI